MVGDATGQYSPTIASPGLLQPSTTSNMNEGAMYFDPSTGQLQTYKNGQWQTGAVLGDVTTTPNVTNDTGAYTGGGTGSNTALQANTINQVYDARNGRLQYLLDQMPTQQDKALGQYNQSWDLNRSALDNSYNQGKANLDFQTQQNDQQKVRSFRDIASGIRNTLESASNRLGTMNAGDSSAAPMLAYALANLQAQQRGQANDVYNTNATQIGLARNSMEGDYNQQLNALNVEKQQRIQDIADKYLQTRQQILDEMANSDQSRAYELANIGQQYTMKALSDINALESQYNQASQQWVSNALASMPKVNTATFNTTPTMSNYGTYGRGAAVDTGYDPNAVDTTTVSPLRKIRQTA